MHPYTALPPRSFWRAAVSEISGFLDFEEVYQAKFPIRPTDRVVTAGSCFAQHIARKLAASGFAYQDFEPAPPFLPGRGPGRFRLLDLFGALRQHLRRCGSSCSLFERAFEGRVPAEHVWTKNGRWFDPYRPAIEPDGFASEDEFRASRRTHMAAVRRMFTESDVFVFTLRPDGGVEVEGRRGACSRSARAPCAGTFDEARHEFRNFGVTEVIDDLQSLIEKVRSVNDGLRFLLTVSPVPLTATATGEHVIVASSYSKAVLRAAAGAVAGTDDGVDYFPSCELVSAHPVRAALFSRTSARSRRAACAFVMRHFFEVHRSDEVERRGRRGRRRRGRLHQDDVVCEEERLETFTA